MELLSPKNDLVFKALFGRHPDLLLDALNCFLSETDWTFRPFRGVPNPTIVSACETAVFRSCGGAMIWRFICWT